MPMGLCSIGSFLFGPIRKKVSLRLVYLWVLFRHTSAGKNPARSVSGTQSFGPSRPRPSILLSDAYGSAGEVTYYHRNGRCYTRRRVKPQYPGTPAQLEHLAIHRRAIAAWASLDSEVQKLWNSYETTAESHRPPYDHKSHISGNNLFMSAYHGFALMGDEHTPVAHPFQMPPSFWATFDSATVEAGTMRLAVDAHVSRRFLAEGDCSQRMTITIPEYTEIWNLGGERFQIQAMCILLDSETGFRSQYQRSTAVIEPSCQ